MLGNNWKNICSAILVMFILLVSFFLLKLTRHYSKGRLYLVSPKFVKLERFAGKEPLVLPMNCASSSSSSNHGIEYSSEMLQQQIEGDKDAVMIVDHGSRREESNLMLNEFVKMFKAKTSYQIVEPAHMELAEPTIKDAFAKCVQHGATRVIVSPFFLFPGRHWHKDIPALVAEACKEHRGVSYVITAPLGLHELLVDVMSDRIKHCVSHVAGVADECDVCAGTGRCRLYPEKSFKNCKKKIQNEDNSEKGANPGGLWPQTLRLLYGI